MMHVFVFFFCPPPSYWSYTHYFYFIDAKCSDFCFSSESRIKTIAGLIALGSIVRWGNDSNIEVLA